MSGARFGYIASGSEVVRVLTESMFVCYPSGAPRRPRAPPPTSVQFAALIVRAERNDTMDSEIVTSFVIVAIVGGDRAQQTVRVRHQSARRDASR